jgi:hypothetical protein
MSRHGASGSTATRRVLFPMLRQAFWRVRPGGLSTGRKVSTVTPLAFGARLLSFGRLLPATVMSRLAHCHAIARMSTVVADHLGLVQRSVFTKVGIVRAYIPLVSIYNYSRLQPPQHEPKNRLQHHFPPEFPCKIVQESRLASYYPVR